MSGGGVASEDWFVSRGESVLRGVLVGTGVVGLGLSVKVSDPG